MIYESFSVRFLSYVQISQDDSFCNVRREGKTQTALSQFFYHFLLLNISNRLALYCSMDDVGKNALKFSEIFIMYIYYLY